MKEPKKDNNFANISMINNTVEKEGHRKQLSSISINMSKSISIHEKLYKSNDMKNKSSEVHQKTIINKLCPFKPKINKKSKQLTASMIETQSERVTRLTYSNRHKSATSIDFKNNFSEKPKRKENAASIIEIPKREKQIRFVKKDLELINQIENFKADNKNKKDTNNKFLHKSLQNYRVNKLKEFYEIISSNIQNIDELNYIEKFGISTNIKDRVIIPAVQILRNKNLEINFNNFYLIANEIMSYIL
jgi:hypothetical protein